MGPSQEQWDVTKKIAPPPTSILRKSQDFLFFKKEKKYTLSKEGREEEKFALLLGTFFSPLNGAREEDLEALRVPASFPPVCLIDGARAQRVERPLM